MINSIDSAEVSALLDMLLLNSMFLGFLLGLIFPKFTKFLSLSVEFLSKKLGKNKQKSNESEDKK